MTSTAISAETSSSFKSGAWVGDLDDLRALVRVLEDLRNSAANSIRLRHEESRPARRADAERGYAKAAGGVKLGDDWWVETWEAREATELDEALQRIDVKLRAEHREFARVVEGPVDAVLDEIDVSDLVSLRLSVGKTYRSGAPGIEVRMNRTSGVQVEVRDHGSDWVRVAESKLKTAISKQRPWYWWTRNYWAMAPFFLLPVYITARSTIFSGKLDLMEEVILGILAPSVAFALHSLWQKLVPAFELHKVGSRGRGSRVLAMVGTLALFVLGIAIPLMIPSGK